MNDPTDKIDTPSDLISTWPKGWLKKIMDDVDKEVESWPKWMLEDVRQNL